jgi:hypothetical protein
MDVPVISVISKCVDRIPVAWEHDSLMAGQIRVTTQADLERHDREYWRSRTPEERLDHVELLRLEAGKFLYEYPARLRRTVTIIRKT